MSIVDFIRIIIVTLFFLLGSSIALRAQTASFTYQGKLTDNGLAANGSYQMQFALFDAAANGNQLGATVSISNVQVTNGIFTVSLDFGAAAFSGAGRFLQISVFSNTSASFVALNPRQAVTSAPYAIKSLNAETAENSNNLGGIAANQYVLTGDARLADDRNPTSGSGFYIQNRITEQSGASFNISGNGTSGGTLSGNAINSATQYNINGARVFGIAGVNNVFAGLGAGSVNTGIGNSFFGRNAGLNNTSGSSNSFFGGNSGDSNTTGGDNSFFGRFAGGANTTGEENSFFGSGAGDTNTNGNLNSFFGKSAGGANTTGSSNTFIGRESGLTNTTGYFNTFAGRNSGDSNTTGYQNTFFGANAGFGNVSGNNNTYIGYNVGSSVAGNSNNTFIGANAGNQTVSGSNNVLIGSNASINAIWGSVSNSVAIGAGASVSESNQIVLGSGQRVMVPGTIDTQGRIYADGLISGQRLYADELLPGGSVEVCYSPDSGGGLAYCSSSRRYKTNIEAFSSGLNLVNRLKPVSFNWKSNGKPDLGLVAEEVAEVEPLLVTYNNGQIEGVKYDRIGVVLLNAVREQQTEIESLKRQVEVMKKLVCAQNAAAEVCKEEK